MLNGVHTWSDKYEEAAAAASFSLLRHPQPSLAAYLQRLSKDAEHQSADYYGRGGAVSDFEQQCATLFDKSAALFLPSGTLAQPIALRIYAEQRGIKRVALHPTSHLLLHEEQGIDKLWQLDTLVYGEFSKTADLKSIQTAIAAAGGAQQVAALVYELPMREIGGQLPEWSELVNIAAWLKAQNIALHIDGARIWQCPPYFDKSLAEIAALADSVYVSLYKDLGGIAGAVLLGDADFIDEAKVWARRAGGNLPTMYPFALAAQRGLEDNQQAIYQAVDYARELALGLARLDGVKVNPATPQAAMFHLTLNQPTAKLMQKVAAYTQRTGVLLLPKPRNHAQQNESPHSSSFELSIGRNALAKPVSFWLTHFKALLTSDDATDDLAKTASNQDYQV
ncbi:MAG: threonine aldolase [Idiomarina sp.]|nr:threonine aldolase [Idiomarina sp.]